MTSRVTPVVGIVDYQAGNLQSIENALGHLGAGVVRVRANGDEAGCTHILLPGVGAFGFCARQLRRSGLIPMLGDWALEARRPLLGICVGMQLMAEGSDESPDEQGIGWLGGRVERIAEPGAEVRVPHVGWNTVTFREPLGDFETGAEADFYFDHSFGYGVPARGHVLGEAQHGRTFSAAVRQHNIVAAQFHPEKSQQAGMRFLLGFLAL